MLITEDGQILINTIADKKREIIKIVEYEEQE